MLRIHVSRIGIEEWLERGAVGKEKAAVDTERDHGEGVAEQELANGGQHGEEATEEVDAAAGRGEGLLVICICVGGEESGRVGGLT